MPAWFDHLLALVLAVFFPIRAATFGYRRLALAPEPEVAGVRRSLYLQALSIQWGLLFLLITIWTADRRAWSWLGLAASPSPLFLAVTAAALVGAALLLIHGRMGGRDPRVLDVVARRLAHMERMLPHSREELRVFQALSITAGVCEEALYRGYLMWYAGHWMGPAPALLVTSLVFGFGHSYQGARGVMLTGLVGVALGLVYLLAGSLLPAMILHAAGDLHSGGLAHAALNRRAETRTEST